MNQSSLNRLEKELDATPNEMRRRSGLPPLPKTAPAQTENNGGDANLPADRLKAVEYGLAQFQQVAHERDELRKEVTALRERVAAFEIETEGLRAQNTDAQSQISSAQISRDQAMSERIKWEALFVSIQAQLRAFAVPASPLIADADFGTQR